VAIVQRTGVSKSVAFARWQQRAALVLGSATLSSLLTLFSNQQISINVELNVQFVKNDTLSLYF